MSSRKPKCSIESSTKLLKGSGRTVLLVSVHYGGYADSSGASCSPVQSSIERGGAEICDRCPSFSGITVHPSSRVFAPTVLSLGGGVLCYCTLAAWPLRNYPSAGECTAMPCQWVATRVCCDIRLQICKVWFQLKHRIPTNEYYESLPGRCRRSVTVCPLPPALVASLIKLQIIKWLFAILS